MQFCASLCLWISWNLGRAVLWCTDQCIRFMMIIRDLVWIYEFFTYDSPFIDVTRWRFCGLNFVSALLLSSTVWATNCLPLCECAVTVWFARVLNVSYMVTTFLENMKMSGNWPFVWELSEECQEKFLSGKTVVFKEQNVFTSVNWQKFECVYNDHFYYYVSIVCVKCENMVWVGVGKYSMGRSAAKS